MPLHKLKNNFETTLAAAITTTGQTSISLTADPGIGYPYYLTIGNDPKTGEIIEITATGVMIRAKQGTTAQTFPIGTKVQMLDTAGHWEEMQAATKEYFDFGKSGHLVLPRFAKNMVTRLDANNANKAIIPVGAVYDINVSKPSPIIAKLPDGTEKVIVFYGASGAGGANMALHYAEAATVENKDGSGSVQPYTKGANGPLFPTTYAGYLNFGRCSIIINQWLQRYEMVVTKDNGQAASKALVFLTCPLSSDLRIQANWTNHGVIYSTRTSDLHGLAAYPNPVLILNGNEWLIYFSNNIGGLSVMANYENPTVAAKWGLSSGTQANAQVLPNPGSGSYNFSIFYLDGKYYVAYWDAAASQWIKIFDSTDWKFTVKTYTEVSPALSPSAIASAYDETATYQMTFFPHGDSVYLFVLGDVTRGIGLMKVGKRA